MASPTILIRGIGKFVARLSRLEVRASKTGQRVETLSGEVATSEKRLAQALGADATVTATVAEVVANTRVAHALASREHFNALRRHTQALTDLKNTQAAEARHLERIAESVPAAQRNAAALDRANRIAAETSAARARSKAYDHYEKARKLKKEADKNAASAPSFTARRAAQEADKGAEAAFTKLEEAAANLEKATADAKAARAERRAAVEARAQADIAPASTIDELAEEAAVKAENLTKAQKLALLEQKNAKEATTLAEGAALENAADVVTRLRPLADAGNPEAREQIRRIQAMSRRAAFETAKEAEFEGIALDEINREGLSQIRRDSLAEDVREWAEWRRTETEIHIPKREPIDQRADALVEKEAGNALDSLGLVDDGKEIELAAHSVSGDAAAMQKSSLALQRAAAVEAAVGDLNAAQAMNRLDRELAVRLMAERAHGDFLSTTSDLFRGRYEFLGAQVNQTTSLAKFSWRLHHYRHQLVHADLKDLKRIDEAFIELGVQQEKANSSRVFANRAHKKLKALQKAAEQPGADAAAQAAADAQAVETATLTRAAEQALGQYHYSLNESNQLLDRVVQSVVVSGAGVAVMASQEANAAQESVNESGQHFQYAGAELRQANEAVAAAEAALDNHTGSEIDKLELEAQLASALELAEKAKELQADAETSHVEARVDKQLGDKATAEEKASLEAEARAEAYTASTAEGIAWEGMKVVGKGALTGLHYAEEGLAYAVDGVGYIGQWPILISSPEDAAAVGHGILAATDAAIEHVVVPVAVATYEGAAAEVNVMNAMEDVKQQQAKAAERVAVASETRDQDEIDKLAPMLTVVTIPDAEPPTPTLVAEAKRKKSSDEAWAKIEAKAQQSLERNMSLIEEGAREEEPNMSVDPSLQSAASVPRV